MPECAVQAVVQIVGQIVGLKQIAIGQQHRVGGFVGNQFNGVNREHIGAIGKISDAAKALGLALGHQVFARGE